MRNSVYRPGNSVSRAKNSVYRAVHIRLAIDVGWPGPWSTKLFTRVIYYVIDTGLVGLYFRLHHVGLYGDMAYGK